MIKKLCCSSLCKSTWEFAMSLLNIEINKRNPPFLSYYNTYTDVISKYFFLYHSVNTLCNCIATVTIKCIKFTCNTLLTVLYFDHPVITITVTELFDSSWLKGKTNNITSFILSERNLYVTHIVFHFHKLVKT